MSDFDDISEFLDKKIKDNYRWLMEENIAALQKRSAENKKNALEEQKDKRREDWAGTNKWVISLFFALAAAVAFGMNNLMNQINAFNKELRDVRSVEIRELSDRVTVIETERRIEKSAAP